MLFNISTDLPFEANLANSARSLPLYSKARPSFPTCVASYDAISDRFTAAKEDFLKYKANSVAVFGIFVAPFRVTRPLGSVTATRKSEVDWRFAGSYLEKCEPLEENRSN